MKFLRLFFGFSLLLVFSNAAVGQTFSKEAKKELRIMESSKETAKSIEFSPASHNEILIWQVGNGHSIENNVSAENSTSSYFQQGRNHTANVLIKANSYNSKILQTGNGNYVFENVYAPTEEVSLNLSQNGRNLHFERHGSNSIGDKLDFKMNGSNKSIIVRNFK